ncbi:MAG: hypothetical protein HYV34_03300 [Candidatus Kerfeldbacteria bacterium]|nr:hypothetical protein [Candidatus Kerfeldbacteria bacterium]
MNPFHVLLLGNIGHDPMPKMMRRAMSEIATRLNDLACTIVVGRGTQLATTLLRSRLPAAEYNVEQVSGMLDGSLHAVPIRAIILFAYGHEQTIARCIPWVQRALAGSEHDVPFVLVTTEWLNAEAMIRRFFPEGEPPGWFKHVRVAGVELDRAAISRVTCHVTQQTAVI